MIDVLWRWVGARHLFQEGGRSLLTLLGVALGVAVFVSIRLANHSALSSFSDTVDAVAGKANLQIAGDSGGFDETVLSRLQGIPGLQATAPVVQAYARARMDGKTEAGEDPRETYSETLLVLGIDPTAMQPFEREESSARIDPATALQFAMDPTAVAITSTLARRHRLERGARITMLADGHPTLFTVVHFLDSPQLQQAMGGNIVIMSLASTQQAFGRQGKLDRIDLLVDPARKEAVTAALTALLPSGTRITHPAARTRQVENMVEAFGLNLTALAFIALFVSMFLIFNAVSMAVLRRRKEIGILRSLGVTRRQIIVQFLSEALFLGVVGSIIGLLLGTVMARGALGSVAQTISTLYLQVNATHLYLDPGVYLFGFALGVGMSLLSALAPAIEASQTPPSVTMRQGIQIEAQPLPLGRLTGLGLSLLVMAALVTVWTVSARRPFGGFVSAFLLLFGFSLVAPGFTLLCERFLSPLVAAVGGIEARLGVRYLREAVARTSVVVAALMVSVGMLIALTVMVGSFRKTVDIWIRQTIRGDLYVEPAGRDVSTSASAMPESLIAQVRKLPGVAAVDTYRGVEVPFRDRITHVGGIDFDVQARYGKLQFIGTTAEASLTAAERQAGVIITESFGFRHRLRNGDLLELLTPSGTQRFPITGVFYDYSTDGGYLMMDRALFERLWKVRRTERIAVYVQPGVDVDRVRTQLLALAPKDLLLIATPNLALRQRALRIFDQTFRITYALQGIAILVSVLGVISTLTALILQRGREIGVLRAVGARRGQVQKMVLVESGVLGLIGSLLGCLCGLALSYLLTFVINKQFFGWSIRYTLEPEVFIQSVGMMVVASILAGIGPARLAATRVAAEAMRVE